MKTLEIKSLGLEELSSTEAKETKGGWFWIVPFIIIAAATSAY